MINTSSKFPNAVIGRTSKELKHIHSTSKNIAIYQRSTAAVKKECISVINKSMVCQASGNTQEIISSVKSYFDQHQLKAPLLLEDLAELLHQFGGIAKCQSFRLLLTTVDTDMCRKFHTDINDLRLLCTYIGPGTLWLPNEAIHNEPLQNKNDDIVADASLIQQASEGDVVILKGALYPDANPILHRSPTIEEKGEKRLLLRIDTNASQNLWS